MKGNIKSTTNTPDNPHLGSLILLSIQGKLLNKEPVIKKAIT